jgi:hypothetical protein
MKDSRYRGMPSPDRFVRFVDYYYSTVLRHPSSTEPPGVRTRRIFVIKQSIRPATNPAGKAIQRILICDDHPDSLRLVLGHRARSRVQPAPPASARWWDPILGGMLVLGALLLIFLPLFLKLPS